MYDYLYLFHLVTMSFSSKEKNRVLFLKQKEEKQWLLVISFMLVNKGCPVLHVFNSVGILFGQAGKQLYIMAQD